MTLSLSLLTARPPTADSDVHPLSRDVDCTGSAKRNVLPPFGIITTTTLTTGNTSIHGTWLETNATLDPDANASHTAFAAPSRWNGIPIRAIVPLPRRTQVAVGVDVNGRAAQNTTKDDTSTRRNVKPCLTRSTHVEDDIDSTDSADEDEDGDGDEDEDEDGGDGDGGRDEDDDVTTLASRCCSYESITAADGLSAWSFEELRVECYAQSLVARGSKPPPVVQPSLAIPPAFVPRSVLRSETGQRKQ